MRHPSARMVVSSVVLSSVAGGWARPVFDIVRVADTQTLIPGGNGAFTGFSFPVAPGTSGAFVGAGAGGQLGVYLGDPGTLMRIADLTTPVPGAPGASFTSFRVVGGGASEGVLFRAETSSGVIGLYRGGVGPLVRVFDTAMPVPGPVLTDFLWADYTNDVIAVSAIGQQGYGAVLGHGGAPFTVADIATPVPGGTGNFQSFGRVGTDGSSIVFVGLGAGGQQGVYHDAGGLHQVANTEILMPGGSGTFTAFGAGVRVEGDSVLFIAQGEGAQRGIYLSGPGGLGAVIDANAAFPGGTTFADFASADLKDGGITFWAEDTKGLEGAFVSGGVGAFPVLLEGETLDGRVVDSIEMAVSADAFDGFYLPMAITFTDGTSGVYIAKIPSPGAGALLLAAVGVIASRRGRRRSAPRA